MKTFLSGRPVASRGATSRFPFTVMFLVIALAVGTSAGAEDVTGEIDRIFSWVKPDAPGCVVSISRYGKVVVNRAYGLADLERRISLTPDTVFDAGSLVKQFVAAAVLLLVEDGRLSLSDDVRTFIPELHDYGSTITVDHLLTHTSGLRDWTGLQMLSGGDEDALTLILRQRGLNFKPGEEWSYSNSGYVLLKELIARRTGMSFSGFVQRRLFEPLGMKSTMYAADIRNAENGALAYQKDGNGWKPDMLLGNSRGGGGALLSTAGDLLLWNEVLTNGRLGAFVTEKMQEPARLGNGRKLGYARGLFLDANHGGRVVWHSGSAGGYKSMLARFPEQGLSVAILSNAGDVADRMISMRRIHDVFVPADGGRGASADTPVPVTGGAGTEGVDVNGRAGLFFSETASEPLRLAVQGGRLGIPGGPALVPVSGDRFRNERGMLDFMSQDEFELYFLSRDQLEVKSMEGRVTRYRRAGPYVPTAAELEDFAGSYGSDELKAVFEAAPGRSGLMIRVNGSQAFEFAPVDADTFQRGEMTVRFLRDGDGNVAAFRYSNPVLRNVTFRRLPGGSI